MVAASSVLASGDTAWNKLLFDGMKSVEKQFLAGYLCASLYYLIEDPHSRQILFVDSEANTAINTALLAAASSTAVMVRARTLLSQIPVLSGRFG